MARRKSDPVLQKLRRLARAGRRQEAADMLEQAIVTNPKHAKARDELARYLTGKPFSFEETEYKELQTIINEFLTEPQRLSSMGRSGLKKLKHRAYYLEQALSHMLSAGELKTLNQLRAAIARERQRRRKPLGKLSLGIAALLAVLLPCGAGCYLLWQRAAQAADVLGEAASANFQRSKAITLLHVHDTGLNRTLNRRVSEQADKLRRLIRLSEQHARELDEILRSIENGTQSVVSQGVRRRALIERRLKELGEDAAALKLRWAALCEKEQEALNQQRLSLVEELISPLPEWNGLKGNPEDDLRLLNDRVNTLRQRVLIYEDAAEALKLPESIIATVRQEMQAHNRLIAEISAFQHLLSLLPTAHSYERYTELLHSFKPEHYLPAIELMGVVKFMPSVASLRGMMQERGQELPPGLLLAAKASLVDGKPSFSAQFPATQEQMHLLRELLTNSALNTRLFELTNTADNLCAYSEELPVLRYGRACFHRSSLDPEREISEDKYIEWQNPTSVVSRTLDPRPLYRELGLDNKSGYSSVVNLPLAISRLLRHQHPDVPPLAKAYVFDHLLRINNSGQHPVLCGLRYAPEMRGAVRSFEKLRESCGIRLDGNCWLRRTPAHAEAERKFLRWFNKHRHVDFVAELQKNLRALLSVTPQFCGYINEKSEAVFFETVPDGQVIWYLSPAAMTTSAWGDPLQEPVRLSPVFIMKKTR